VAAGKSRLVVIGLPYTAFEFFDRTSGKMAVAAGVYEVWYGDSSDTKDLKSIKVTIE
jgi:beta-glucosidase